MNKVSKACDIKPKVKQKVYERDNGECILCHRRGAPNAHYIPRSQLGLGIEQNIVTLCTECHNDYDNGNKRLEYGERIKNYLKSQYPDWNETLLVYDKYRSET